MPGLDSYLMDYSYTYSFGLWLYNTYMPWIINIYAAMDYLILLICFYGWAVCRRCRFLGAVLPLPAMVPACLTITDWCKNSTEHIL